MWLFTCAEARNPIKPAPQFIVHRPPSSEWTYGAWVGNKDEHLRAKQALAERARHATKLEASSNRYQKNDQRGFVDHSRPRVHQQPRREKVQSSGARWATLAEIEANERYGPRGRNERYERSGSESVDGRYESAYAKLVGQSERKGRSHRQQDNGSRSHRQQDSGVRDRRGGTDPWKADAGIAVPKVGKFREDV